MKTLFSKLSKTFSGKTRSSDLQPSSQNEPRQVSSDEAEVIVEDPQKIFEKERCLAEIYRLFDPEWYLLQNNDVRVSEMDPFYHYMTFGYLEMRPPSELFNKDIYTKIIPSFPANENPITHFLQNVLTDYELLKKFTKIVPKRQLKPIYGGRLLPGVTLSGHFKSEVGLGQAIRNLAYSMDDVRIPVTFWDIDVAGRSTDYEFASKCSSKNDRRVNLLVMGLTSLGCIHGEHVPGRINILYPYWELIKVPDQYKKPLSKRGEIWAPSRFIAEAFRNCTDVPVTLVRQPVRIPEIHEVDIASQSSEGMTMLTFFDFDSYSERKNPMAAVEAFQRAFPRDIAEARLIVKTHGQKDRGVRTLLNDLAINDPRIQLVDKTLSRTQMNHLIWGCDAFVSMHRSEGFGFGAAEALAAGKAVVSTDFSGTTDFITGETGYPVRYQLVPVEDNTYPHWEDQVWAEPDVDDAAKHLQTIFSDRSAAKAKGKIGRKFMEANYSPEIIGKEIMDLLVSRNYL